VANATNASAIPSKPGHGEQRWGDFETGLLAGASATLALESGSATKIIKRCGRRAGKNAPMNPINCFSHKITRTPGHIKPGLAPSTSEKQN
jgi:hypothetical protein